MDENEVRSGNNLSNNHLNNNLIPGTVEKPEDKSPVVNNVGDETIPKEDVLDPEANNNTGKENGARKPSSKSKEIKKPQEQPQEQPQEDVLDPEAEKDKGNGSKRNKKNNNNDKAEQPKENGDSEDANKNLNNSGTGDNGMPSSTDSGTDFSSRGSTGNLGGNNLIGDNPPGGSTPRGNNLIEGNTTGGTQLPSGSATPSGLPAPNTPAPVNPVNPGMGAGATGATTTAGTTGATTTAATAGTTSATTTAATAGTTSAATAGGASVLGAILPWILLAIVIIGLIGFLFNMPGLMIGKIKQIAQGLWDGLESLFGNSAEAFINDDDVTDLAQYLVDMDYDLIGYGFVRAREVGTEKTYLELEEDGYHINEDGQYVNESGSVYPGQYYNAAGYLVDNEVVSEIEEDGWFVAEDLVKDKYGIRYWASDGEFNGKNHTRGQIAEINDRDGNVAGIIDLKSNASADDSLLRAYLMADYRITVLRNDDEGVLENFGNYLSKTLGGAHNAWSKGMIKIFKRYVDEDDKIVVESLDWTDEFLWIDDVSIKDGTKLSLRNDWFNRPMEFQLDGWTGRYGLSLEFLLSLHLGTMAPDLVTAMLQCFDTEVQVYVEEIEEAQVFTKYKDYEVDDFENDLPNNDEEVTIESMNEILDEAGYWVDIQDGYFIEWVNELSLTKAKCYDLLIETGLSSPPGCIYTSVAYVILNMQSRYGEWLEQQNCNYLSYNYGVVDPLLEDVEYRVKEDTDAYYTAKNSLYSLRNDMELGNDADPTVTTVISDGLTTYVEPGREEAKNKAKEYGLTDDNIEPSIEIGYTGEGSSTKRTGEDNKEVIGEDGYVYRIERDVEVAEWPIYGYLDGNNFVQVTEDEFNADETGAYEETTGYYNSYIYKIYQTGIVDDSTEEVIHYKDGGVIINNSGEDSKGILIHKFTFEFFNGNDESLGERSLTIYFNPNKETYYDLQIEKFDCYDETGVKQELTIFNDTSISASGMLYLPIEYECICPSCPIPAEKHRDDYYFDLNIEENMEEGTYTFSITPDNYSTIKEPGIVSSFYIEKGDNQVTRNINTVQQGINDEYLYDVLYMNFVVRDKTVEELIDCGILESDGHGGYITNEEVGKCSTPEPGDDINKCCSVCQKYVKGVIRALAQIQDTEYSYFQPYIARVVGSWFRDTYFIIPTSEDGALVDYYGQGKSPVGSWGSGGSYVKVDEEYLNSTGEYWTDYVMKTETLEDGTEIETDEYQLYYLNPDGTTSNITLEEWLESEENVNSEGNKYMSQEEAEKDGYVFVKKAKLLSLNEIKQNTLTDNGGGRDLEEAPYMQGTLWSAYTVGEGGDSGWIKINRGEVDNVDKVLDMVNDQGEFYYRLQSTKSIEQEEDAIRTETNVTVKNLFRYRQFYIYDGSRTRAELIQKDRENVNELIIAYWNGGNNYTKSNALEDLKNNGRYALRSAYGDSTIEDFTIDEQVAESWLEYQLDMYYTSNFKETVLNDDKFKLDELCEFGVENNYLDSEYYTSEGHSLDPRARGLIATVNITKSSLDAFSILENVNTLDADYQYRDFKELIVELNYFDKEDLSETVEEVFTWIVPTYTTLWPIQAIDKQNNEYGTLVHSQASIDFLIKVYEKLVEEEKNLTEEDSETIEPEEEDGESTSGAESENEQILMQLKEAQSYAENAPVISPVTGKIISYGEHSRINVYTNETETVGYVKIEIMGYGEGKTPSESYFTEAMLAEANVENDKKEMVLKGLNGFYDEYKDNCAGYILTIDGIDITDLKNGFSSVTDAEGNTVEYEELCHYEVAEGIALYNSKEQKRREEIAEGKAEAPYLIKYNVNYNNVDNEYFATDTLGGYYVKEGAYLGKTQSPTDRNPDNVVAPNPNAAQGGIPNLSEDSELVDENPDRILYASQLYNEFLDENLNPDYLRIILLDTEMTVVDNVEDYFPGFEEGSGNGSGSVTAVDQEYVAQTDDLQIMANLLHHEGCEGYFTGVAFNGDSELGKMASRVTGYVCINRALSNYGGYGTTISEQIAAPGQYSTKDEVLNGPDVTCELCLANAEWCLTYDCSSVLSPDGEPMPREVTGQSGWCQCNGAKYNCWWWIDTTGDGEHTEYTGPGSGYDTFYCK